MVPIIPTVVRQKVNSPLKLCSRPTQIECCLTMLCFSGFLDLFGVSLVIPFLPKHLKGLGETYTMVGFVSSIYGFLQFFSAPIVGNLSDRYGRKHILIISLSCTALSYLLMTANSLSASILLIAISRIPPGLLKHSQSLTKAVIARSPTALSFFNAASTTGFIVGPPLTGFLMDQFGPKIGYSIAGQLAAASFSLNALLVYLSLPNEHSQRNDGTKTVEHSSKQPLQHDDNGLRSTCARLAKPPLCSIYIAKFLNSQALLLSRSAFMLYLEMELKLSSSEIGWLSSLGPFITVLFAPLVTPVCSYFQNTAPRLQAICCLLDVLSSVLLLLAPSAIYVAFYAIPHGLSSAVGRVNFTSLSLLFGGGASVGTLIGLDQSVLSFSRTIAPAIAGLLMDISLRLPFALTVGLLIPTALIFEHSCTYTSLMTPTTNTEK